MKKRLLLFWVVLMGLTSAMATDEITCSNLYISRGETKTFGIQLSNEATNYVGFQIDLTLPEGLTLNKTGCSLSARITDENQELTIGKQGENTYRFTSTSFSLTPISGTSGELITVSVTAGDSYQGGNATISNIQFATSESERVTINDVAFNIHNNVKISFADEQVKAICVTEWDTNGDGELDTEEAAAVTYMRLIRVFYKNKDITSFDELQYFTGLTSIYRSAFEGCSGLTSITIPESVTSIGDFAFSGCSGLTSITIPESVTYIGYSAFDRTAWYNNLPDGLNYVGKVAYKYKGTMPENTNIAIKQGTVSIYSYAFSGCSGLTSVIIPNSVTDICYDAFNGCSGLTSITIPNSVTNIGSSAFDGCSGLTSITIPSSVTTIGEGAFQSCSGLTSIMMESGNTSYDSRDNCNAIIEKATNTLIVGCQNSIIPNSVTGIGNFAFSGCSSLTSVTIPESVTDIGWQVFSGCSGLTSITIPESVTSIGGNPFSNCSSLTFIAVDADNTVYDSRDNCNAIIEKATNTLIVGCKNTVIPESVTNIRQSAFSGCSSLTFITIPNGVTTIGEYAFSGCSSLTSVTIGNSVATIGNYAFNGCSGLTSVVMNNSSPFTINSLSFFGTWNVTLYVPKDSKASYAAADYWKGFYIKEYPDPDVNQDGYVDVVDVVDVARFVVGTPSESFEQFLADLNGSGEVNVADAVVLVNEIAGDVDWSRPMHAPAISDGILTLTKNTDQSLSFSLKDDSAYTAFQFDLTIPEGMDVTQMTLNSSRKQNHQLLYNKISDGHYRVVALSTSNQSFNGTAGELLSMALDDQPADDTMIDNIHFVTAQGKDLLFDAIGISGDTPTGISYASRLNDNGERRNGNIVYNLNGQRLTKAQKGLYIIHGKKVVVK